MTTSITSALGAGSGLDITNLVDSLTAADRAPKDAALKKREDANTAKVSALADAASGIDTFASALSTLISGGSLFSQPTVSDTSVLAASAVAGARLSGLSAEIEVVQLAKDPGLQRFPVDVGLANEVTIVFVAAYPPENGSSDRLDVGEVTFWERKGLTDLD